MTGLRSSLRQLKSDYGSIARSVRLARALPDFFRQRISLQQAEEGIKGLLESRVERFLQMAQTQIYQRPGSPYLRLLKFAGCEFADLQSQVRRHGLEATLVKLAGEGVYLSSDEFKGKTEVVRGGDSFRVSPADFEAPDLSAGFVMQSSGTRNRPIDTFNSLEWRALQAMGVAVFYFTHDLLSSVHAVYEPIIAGRITFVVINGKLGIPTSGWFALKVSAHSLPEDKYHRLNARLVAMIGRRFGVGIVNPEYLEVANVEPILAWIRKHRRKGKSCCITSVASSAVRIARAALAAGLSLQGTSFHLSGEPLTQSKKQLIDAADGYIAPHYGPGGGNSGAFGCGNRQFIDEMHVPQTMFTLVQHPQPLDFSGLAIRPLMLTTQHPAAPRLLLNVQNGDYATMIERDCGCPLQKVGFTQHLHTIRSFEKFTSEGMNYFTADLFDLLERILPGEFGGAAGDYQLVEEEDSAGQTRLNLLVHPAVGELNEQALLARLQEGLAGDSRNHLFMSKVWQAAGTLRVRREAPYASARGKVLPLRINP